MTSLTIDDAVGIVAGAALDLGKVTSLVQQIITAAPAIVSGLVSIEPYVEAVATMISNGGNPTDAQWATLEASLNAGSAALQAAADDAAAQLQAAGSASTTEE